MLSIGKSAKLAARESGELARPVDCADGTQFLRNQYHKQ